jgi:NAD+ kinase
MKQIGIIFNPKRQEAVDFSRKLHDLLKAKNVRTWHCSAWEPEKVKAQIPGTDLAVSVGGDGTILRTARAIIPELTPLLGVNLGNLGFMSELTAEQTLARLDDIVAGKGWLEERAVLEARLVSQNKAIFALNDVFIGRRSSARLVNITCKVDGELLAIYRADGVIVTTASGSTGYALAAGGPILHPTCKDIVLQPVCAHLSFSRSLVLPPNTEVELKLNTTHEGLVSIDGQVEEPLYNDDVVLVKTGEHTIRFVRFRPENYFYSSIDNKLNRKS